MEYEDLKVGMRVVCNKVSLKDWGTGVITAIGKQKPLVYFKGVNADLGGYETDLSPDYIEPADKHHYTIIMDCKDAKTTNIILTKDGEQIAKAKSRCHPNDTYDYKQGFCVALSALLDALDVAEAKLKSKK